MNDVAYKKELDFIKHELSIRRKPSTRTLSLIWLMVGIGTVLLIFQGELVQLAEALYAIPPTPSWTTIGIANNVTVSNSTQTSIQAVNYTDTFRLITDGSILLNITTYP